MVEHAHHSKAQTLKSLDLALRVLESFGHGRSERGVTELATEFNVSKATIYRVLATLERRDYVVQNPSNDRYQLGPVTRRLGQMALTQIDLPVEARPYMEELRDRVGEEVHLAVLDGSEVVYIAKVDGLQPVQVASSTGTRCPVHCVSTGKALLAHADPGYLERLAAAGIVRYTERTYATLDSLAKELARIRQHGYAVNRGEWRTEVSGVAAPVSDGTQKVVAAIGICGPSMRLNEQSIATSIPAVVDVARRLSERLGARAHD
jgi:DNA-binding IclR family transcriptional regulator